MLAKGRVLEQRAGRGEQHGATLVDYPGAHLCQRTGRDGLQGTARVEGDGQVAEPTLDPVGSRCAGGFSLEPRVHAVGGGLDAAVALNTRPAETVRVEPLFD